ncbi:MAG TPA: glycosyltransferase family A protein [Coriobacteriia bacterium]|nr:glycosyltransferase family A protein [Coriobacteriia bacterium]
MAASVDILMITYERPQYVALSLPRLLESCDDDAGVFLWHNGNDQETLATVSSYAEDPRVRAFHHSPENVGLRAPTNWLWEQSTADFVSKVDDDCLVDPQWLATLRATHADSPEVGVAGSWRFYDEDFDERALRKVITLANGRRLMRHPWVQGSGYLAKRTMVEQVGLLGDGQSFTQWCLAGARRGWVNGWAFPFVHEEHMDDPRSPFTIYTDDEAFRRWLPLSARATGVQTVADWTDQMRRSARILQTWSPDPRQYSGWRQRARQVRRRVERMLTGRQKW